MACTRRALLLYALLPVCAPSWVRLTEAGGSDGLPAPRYGHAAAIVAPYAGAMSLAVTWGYSSTPSEARWLDDAWFTSPSGEGVRWRRGVSPPFARFGHVLLPLEGGLLLHGGDDGGRATPLLGGGYTPGSYTAESWLLEGQGGEWSRAAVSEASEPPPALAGHACAQLNGEAALCFGGSAAAAPTRSRPDGYAVPDSDDTWLVVLAGDAVTWTRVATAARPAARHGHSMAFLPRPAVVPAISALEAPSIMLENAVYLTGGSSVNSSACGGRLAVGPCTHSDLWRFVWYSESGAGGRGATSGMWQRVAFSGREDLRPSARSYAGMAGVSSVHTGLGLAPLLTPSALLHGGAECDPSCTCFADTWLLVPVPIAMVAVGRLSAPLITHVQAGVAWRRVGEGYDAGSERPPVGLRPPSAPYSLSDEAVSSLGAELTVLHAAQASSSGSWLQPAAPAVPHGRYRHSLNSLEATSRMLAWAEVAATQAGSALAALLRTDSGGLAPEDLRSFLTEALADPPSGLATPHLPPLPTVALLFGGESYQPSTYYSDVWAWSDAEVVRRTFDGGRVRRARPKAPLSDGAVAFQYAMAAAAYFLGLGGLLRLAAAWRARLPWANRVLEDERLAAALLHDEEGHAARRDSPIEGSAPGCGLDGLDMAVLSSLRWLRRVQGRAEAKRRHA